MSSAPGSTGAIGAVLLGAPASDVAAAAAALGPAYAVRDSSDGLPAVRAVIGVSHDPWPAAPEAHEAARRAAPAPYFAVESWHRLPAFVAALAAAAARGRERLRSTQGDHLLVTAPHRATVGRPPARRVFLREIAQDVAASVPDARPTIAWDHSPSQEPVTPTLVGVLATLAEAHERVAVVRCAVAPGDRGDPAARAAADRLGLELVEVAPTDADRLAALAEVVRTVVANEPALQAEDAG